LPAVRGTVALSEAAATVEYLDGPENVSRRRVRGGGRYSSIFTGDVGAGVAAFDLAASEMAVPDGLGLVPAALAGDREAALNAVGLRGRPVDVRHARSVRERRDVQRDLHLPGNLQCSWTGERFGQPERGAGRQQRPQLGDLRGLAPVVVRSADIGPRGTSVDQRVDQARCGSHQLRRNNSRQHHEPAFGELPDMFWTQHAG
jgi:hypothetical protein